MAGPEAPPGVAVGAEPVWGSGVAQATSGGPRGGACSALGGFRQPPTPSERCPRLGSTQRVLLPEAPPCSCDPRPRGSLLTRGGVCKLPGGSAPLLAPHTLESCSPTGQACDPTARTAPSWALARLPGQWPPKTLCVEAAAPWQSLERWAGAQGPVRQQGWGPWSAARQPGGGQTQEEDLRGQVWRSFPQAGKPDWVQEGGLRSRGR